jgi:hypothetical protein
MALKMNQFSDPDELFSKSPNVLKLTTTTVGEISKEKENNVVKTKKNVPPNITCHCAGTLTKRFLDHLLIYVIRLFKS